jgi:molybdate transport system substrate-binding protein
MMRTLLALSLSLATAACSCSNEGDRTEVTLAVAASLRNVVPELAAKFEKEHDVRIVATYGASGDLRKQVEGGAPIDGVIFAGARPVDDLVQGGRVDADSRRVLATNTLVLIGPKGARPLTFATIDTIPASEKLAVGDPGAVPAGQYAREYLGKLGSWEKLSAESRLVLGGDVAAVLAYARRGEVPAAIVYRTEVRGIEDVVILDEATGPGAPRPEIVSAVVTKAPRAAEARAFLDFIASAEGQAILAAYGFGPP